MTVSTISGGSGWLSASPLSGSIPAGQGTLVTVSVNPGGLAPGDYYGQIRIDAPAAPNSPRLLSVVLNVSAATVNPGPVLDQTGLVFVGLVSGADPSAQAVRITNLTNRPSSFTAAVSALGTQNPFTVSPTSGSVSPNQPVPVSVQPKTAGLTVGVYRGSLILQFPQDNTNRVVDLLLVVTPVLPAVQAEARMPDVAAATCKPTKLLPVFTLLGANFNILVAWPTPIEVKVVDDCGTLLTNGSVSATFSNGDPQITLTSAQDGRWSGTWAAVNPRSSSLTVTATAIQADLNISGTAQVGGAALANTDVPVLALNGMVSSGSYAATATPSPGELVAVFGSQMADGSESASALPLSTRLQNATLTLGGKPLPLVFTSEGQINAQIPYDVAAATTPQMIVQHGNRLSTPQPVTINSAQPAIFSVDLTGKGQGHIYVIPAPGVQALADATAPAKVGDVLQIYCTGLGPVNPPVTAGTATPLDALRNTVTKAGLTIGGVSANVLFSGLTPGFTGLYQINATIPAGVVVGNAVPVVIAVGPNQSPPVTMAVR
jgi:uncharacterized protein (TIGR03437 family)